MRVFVNKINKENEKIKTNTALNLSQQVFTLHIFSHQRMP